MTAPTLAPEVSQEKSKPNGKAVEAFQAVVDNFNGPSVTLERIRVDQVDVGDNVRITPTEIDEMAASILEHGVLSPIKVVGPHKDGRYRLVYGQRRLLGAREAKQELIPAIVLRVGADVDEKGAKRSIEQLVENIVRADLNPIEEARALKEVLAADPSLTQTELAHRLGRSDPWISNALRLLGMAPGVQALVVEGKLTAGHARAIAGLTEHSSQEEIAKRAVQYDYTAKQVENDVRYRKQSSTTEPERREQIKKKTERFAKKLLKIAGEASVPQGATIVAHTYDVDGKQLAGLLKAAGFKSNDSYSYGYRADELKGICDCSAFKFETYPNAHLEATCVNHAHVDALQAQRTTAQKQHERDLRAKRDRLAKTIETGLAGIDATGARLLLAALGGRDLGGVVNAHGDPFLAVEQLSDNDVVKVASVQIATRLTDERGWNRPESQALNALVNKLAAAPAKKGAAAA